MKAVIALGANLDEPEKNVELAISLLERATNVINCSSLYKTKPVGGPTQPDYINAVCIIESQLPPHELLHLLQGIEKSMGRVRDVRWGPRVIDCDLICYGDVEIEDDELILPHPRAHERKFVLEPWLEIDPTATLVGHGSVSEILAQLPSAE